MNKLFPLKHWLLTITLGSGLLWLAGLFFQREDSWLNFGESVGLLFAITLYIAVAAFFFSFPSFVVYYIIFWILQERGVSPKTGRIIMIAAAAMAVFVTFLYMRLGHDSLFLFMPYMLAAILSGLILKIEAEKPPPELDDFLADYEPPADEHKPHSGNAL